MKEKRTHRKRFEKIAGGRLNIILRTLTKLEKCSNKNNYEYTEEDVRKMKKVLNNKLAEVMKSFSPESDTKDGLEFKF